MVGMGTEKPPAALYPHPRTRAGSLVRVIGYTSTYLFDRVIGMDSR